MAEKYFVRVTGRRDIYIGGRTINDPSSGRQIMVDCQQNPASCPVKKETMGNEVLCQPWCSTEFESKRFPGKKITITCIPGAKIISCGQKTQS